MTESTENKRRVFHELQDMAYDLIKRHPEIFCNVPPLSDILFVLDNLNEPKSKGRPVLARLSKISGKVIDFIDAGAKTWMLEWFSLSNGHLTLNQQYLLLAQQLMLFESDGDGGQKLGGYEIQEMEVIADRFGLNWASRNRGEVPDILADDFLWGKVGQSRIDFEKLKQEQLRKAEAALRQPRTEQAQLNVGAGSPKSPGPH